jgi:hypothetical protein
MNAGTIAIIAMVTKFTITEKVNISLMELSCDRRHPVWQHKKLYGTKPKIKQKINKKGIE